MGEPVCLLVYILLTKLAKFYFLISEEGVYVFELLLSLRIMLCVCVKAIRISHASVMIQTCA